jgi:RimJ/RimL family protein N-acetyltransferase
MPVKGTLRPAPESMRRRVNAFWFQEIAMSQHPVLITARLCMRSWRTDDLTPFAALNTDPRVMEFFPKVLNRAESDAMATRIGDDFDRHGFGLWAIQVTDLADFIGYVGLSVPQFEARFTPCVEIGWRLAYEHWGRGYAIEAAQAAARFAFQELRLAELVSFTVLANRRSRRVMERLGMTNSPADDFDHPSLPEGHPLRRHVLYRRLRSDWVTSGLDSR